MSSRFLALVFLLTTLAGFASAQPGDHALKKLQQRSEAFEKHFNGHDADALSTLYSKDCDVVHNGMPRVGREHMRREWQNYFDANPNVQTTIRRDVGSPRLIDENTGIESGRWEDSHHRQAGLVTAGNYTSVYNRIDGDWQIVHERGWPDPTAPLSTGKSVSDERLMPEDVYRQLDRLTGRWSLQSTFQGKSSRTEGLVRWAKGGHCLQWEFSGPDAVTGVVFSANGLIGYDPVTEKAIEYTFSSDGDTSKSTFDFSDPDNWICKGEYSERTVGGKFQPATATREFAWKSDNELVMVKRDWVRDGKAMPEITTVASRTSIAMPSQLAEDLETLLGQWECKVMIGDETKVKQFDAAWQPGRNAIVYRQINPESGAFDDAIVGWDAASQSLVEHGFRSDGSKWEIRWSDIGSGVWKGTGTSTVDGQTHHFACQLTFAGGKSEYRGSWMGKPMMIKRTKKQ
ncbi:SnoaL-like domain protein [Stieleria neptunia]|uniref:SnoaL-like domain protein n=1 Tax=Stieleria neptunia TaxID=2527979 RepID=A0A518HYN8_9BACT|nr:nuclear transport factor 2 family protein [Stieleria neptunia]QDV45965.1 SnoaL-like domain protein [Stieleria neptunia]